MILARTRWPRPPLGAEPGLGGDGPRSPLAYERASLRGGWLGAAWTRTSWRAQAAPLGVGEGSPGRLGGAERRPGLVVLAVPPALPGLNWDRGPESASGSLRVEASAEPPWPSGAVRGDWPSVSRPFGTGALWEWLWAVTFPSRGLSRKC